MENKSYNRFLTDKNKFTGTLNLSDKMIESSDLLLSVILKQTNLKNQSSVNDYGEENINKALETLSNSYYKNPEIFDSIFGFELFENYILSIKNQIILEEYKPILSNKKQIIFLLDELTDIFYTKGHSFDGLEHMWIIFIQSLQDCMDRLEKDQQYPFLSPKKHYNSVIERAIPNNWGWFEFQIRNFVDSFTDTLIDCLNVKSKLIVNQQNLENIYCFSIEVLKRKRDADEGNKDEKGFSTLGEYINPKIDKLARAIKIYEKKRDQIQDINSNVFEIQKSQQKLESIGIGLKLSEKEDTKLKVILPIDELKIDELLQYVRQD